MSCSACGSARVANLNALCDDKCFIQFPNEELHAGDVPKNLGIGAGDYVEFNWCLDCGKIQGTFPVPKHELEQG